MRNYWLKETSIKQNLSLDRSDKLYGKWYILKTSHYLHKDGTWVKNSTKKDGQYTGYYDTREEAERILNEQTRNN